VRSSRFEDLWLDKQPLSGKAGLPMARRVIEAWRRDYNADRPHTGLGGLASNEFAARSQRDHNRNGRWL